MTDASHPGETVLWRGRSTRRLHLTWFRVLGTLAMMVIAAVILVIFWLLAANSPYVVWAATAFIALFVANWIRLLFVTSWLGNTVYTVTDRRVIVAKGRTVTSVPLAEVAAPRITSDRDGVGTLLLRDRTVNRGPGSIEVIDDAVEFVAIPEVPQVLMLIERAAQLRRAVTAHEWPTTASGAPRPLPQPTDPPR